MPGNRVYKKIISAAINPHALYIQVASCDICQRQNHKLRKTNATLHPIPVKNEAWYQLGMDLVGPLPVTPTGNKYLITVTDYYTKWAMAGGLKDKSAASVAEFLYMVQGFRILYVV